MAALVRPLAAIALSGLLLAAPAPARAQGERSAENLAALRIAVREITAAIEDMPDTARRRSDSILVSGPLTRLGGRLDSWSLLGRTRGAVQGRLGELARHRGDEALRDDLELLRDNWALPGPGEASLRDRAEGSLAAKRFAKVDSAMERFERLDLDRSIGIYDRRLDRYEVKYGPGSARLNLLEVMLNGLVQGTPPFRPNEQGPSPNELLLGYSTSYGVVVDGEASALSVLEAGWRRYLLDWTRHEAGDWTGLLRPRYWAVGLAVAPEEDGALRWPLERPKDRRMRAGPFFNWGDLKVAYLFGPEKRFAISRQVQLLPGLF